MGKFSEFISALKDIKEEDEYEKFCRKHMKQFKVTLEEISDDDWQEVQDVVLSCIEVGLENVMEFAYLIVEKKNLIKWKQHKEVLDAILDYLAQHGRKDNIRKLNPYGEFVSRLVKLLQALQLSRAYVDKLCALIDSALSNRRARLLRAVRELNDIPYTKKSDWTISILGRICDIAEENPEMEETEAIALCANRVLHEILDECWQNAKQAARYRDHMVRLFRFCSTQKWETNNPEKKSVCYILTRTTMNRYISLHSQCNRIVEAMAPLVKPLTKCSDKTVARDASIYLDDVAGQIGVDDAKAEEVINKFLNGNPKSSDAAAKFVDIYKSNPSAFNNKYEAIASSMDDKDTEEYIIGYVTEFFKEVVVKDPSKITKGCLKYLIKSIEVDMSANALNVLTPLVEKNKDILVPFEKELLGLMKDYKMFATHGLCGILGNMASENEARSAKYLKVLVDLAKVSENMYRTVVFMAIRQIGEPYPQHLIKYEDYFTPFLEDSTMKDYAVYVIDAMHQRSLATVTQDIEEAKDDVEELDERVTAAEEKVDDVDKDVTQTKVDVAIVKKEVNEQGERLDELGEVVEETIEKVEEMDKKTLSHAPAWCKDVSRIMNEKSDNDWRLLSTKLGYSNDDIRNWATQADPCLSLFDEWFATHKSKAAISKILGIVEEMNRLDAAMIVENALKQAEDVADAEDHDYDTPPDLFISYQWGIQEDVKLLKNHLEMAGYESWMDVGQMGGGDKLFQKIDRGIRAAKVVLCCVTEEYTKSPNCNREVNLSVNLGKPIIPLLMEKMSWPPSGSMGPIFGEYLFIRFFARQGECANDDRYWPTAKFQELLMQLRYNIIPNDSLICDPYRGWESPPEEMIIIQPKTQENKSSVVSANITLNEEPSPDVFISYQWGKQPQIKALYKKLTEMGYSCWLDIMQMGGGDSLYDKIDKGVRGCKIVLICVTTKYSLSANCRREVSLADAIKKPIVPLLLEKITWPPEGPMGMVFTQLLYINFCKHDVDVQNHWECPQMEELFSKINEQIPYMAVDIVPSDETYDKNETKLTINGTNNDFHKEKNNQPIEEEPKEDHMSFNPSNKESQIQSTSYSPEEQQNEKDNDTNEESTNKESQNKAQESNGNNPAASTPKGNEKSSSCNIL